MKLRFLGTGYFPLPKRKNIGHGERDSASVLIDGALLPDPTDTVFRYATRFSMSDMLDRVHTVLISHSHLSHCSADAVRRLSERRPLTVLASEAVLSLLPVSDNLTPVPLVPFGTACVGEYAVTALPATHTSVLPGEVCLNFLIQGDRRLFYALDGGRFLPDVADFLGRHPVDAMLLDGAYGEETPEGENEHLSLASFETLAAEAATRGFFRSTPRYRWTHLPEDAGDALLRRAKAMGLFVPHDGYFCTL